MTRLIFFTSLVFSFLNLQSQIFLKKYSNLSSPPNSYYFSGKRIVSPTSDNGMIFSGSDIAGNMNVTKLDASGCIIWTKSYDFGMPSEASLIKVLNDGNYLVGGSLNDRSSIIQKINAAGVVIWAKKMTLSSGGVFTDAAQTGNELVIINGQSNSSGTITDIVKIDEPSGNVLSIEEIRRTPMDAIDTYNECNFTKIVPASFGGYYLAGEMAYTGVGKKAVLMYMDPSGNYGSCQVFSTFSGQCGIWEMINLPSNNLLVAIASFNDYSYIPSFPNSKQRITLLKIDNSGNVSWQKFYDETNPSTIYTAQAYPNSIAVTNSGDFLVAGVFDDNHGGINSIFKIDANGNVVGDLYKLSSSTGINSLSKTVTNDFILNCNSEGIARTSDNLNDLCNTIKVPFTSQIDTAIHINTESFTITNILNQTVVNPAVIVSSQTVQTLCGIACPCNYVNSTMTVQTACSSYSLNGQTYTASGTYTQIQTNSSGCIDTLTIILTITPVITNAILCPGTGSSSLYSSLTGTNYQWQLNSGSGYANIVDNANYAGSSTSVLYLQNIPSSNYGNQYRCIVDGNNSNAISIKFINSWTGTIDNTWENPGNWSCNAIPDGNTDVFINSGAVVLHSNGICRSIYVNPSASFTANPGFTLTITH